MKRRMIQDKLLTDLKRLLAGIARLENQLRQGRVTRWLVNGTLYVAPLGSRTPSTDSMCRAAVWGVVVVNTIPFSRRGTGRKRVLTEETYTYLGTLGYLLSLPMFAFPLLNYEKQLSYAMSAKEEFLDLYGLVRKGDAIDDRDIQVFADSQWDPVPWSKVKGYM
jgi:hypothetical protein